jgi:proline iminopeptidase
MEVRTELHPSIEPTERGMLALDDVHTMYWETSGNPHGIPVVFLHGGPGGGCSPEHRRFFDPAVYRIILYDQRGSGASTPYGVVEANTTRHLVADLEQLRERLGVDRWVVFGGSWGSTLALAYGQAHPMRCLGFVLRGIFLGRPKEIEWFLHGMMMFQPEVGRRFLEMLPPGERADPLGGYVRRLFDPDPAVHRPFSAAWSEYEGMCASLRPDARLVREYSADSLSLARMEAHYFANGCFLGPNELIENLYRIRHLPASIVHARYDIICPLANADELSRHWPSARFVVVEAAGHSVWEPGVRTAVLGEMERFHRRIEGVW